MDPQTSSPRLHRSAAGVAHIVFDAPDRSVNVLTEEVMLRLRDLLGEVETEARAGRIQALLLSSAKPSSFIAGANIDALNSVVTPKEGREVARLGQEIFLALERLPIPTMAAIHGTALGGGFEIALAARYRVATDHPATKVGLPEVQLGILPAWGGTTRLPRLIGLAAALDLLLSGRTLSGKEALKQGILDDLLPVAGFQEAAEALLLRWKDSPPLRRRRRGLLPRLLEGNPLGRRILFSRAEKSVHEKTGGHYPAPLMILRVLRQSQGLSMEGALDVEADAAGILIASAISKHLIHVFRLRERARKGGGLSLPEALEVRRIGVLGAGVMGGGIAQLAASSGISARLRDIRTEAIGDALHHASELFDAAARKRRMTRLEAAAGMERISGGIDLSGFGQVQVVVEAVVEKMEVKKKVLAEVEARIPPDAVLTSNTSSLSIDEMAKALQRPESFLGMHFFNPVHRMPLVEIVRGARTSESAIAAIFALSLRMGKVPVVVRDGPGFLVNRILTPYLNEAGFLLGEGMTVEEIDQTATSFGMPMGPLRLIDEIGIDVMHHVGTILHQGLGERLSPAPALLALHASGRLGKKGGLGIYRHSEETRSEVDPGIYRLVGASSRELAGVPETAVRDRLVLAMVNEAARALEDGISASAGEVDLAMIMGTGFPPFRGGLLRFADELGVPAILERLKHIEGKVGPRFAPAPLLNRLRNEERGFYDAFPTPP
jgi:3-hydroxyacyl-CoA dehydrogenase/enoyl-CoA hydratase/3-hydroxybutyryl-CoA epimerase